MGASGNAASEITGNMSPGPMEAAGSPGVGAIVGNAGVGAGVSSGGGSDLMTVLHQIEANTRKTAENVEVLGSVIEKATGVAAGGAGGSAGSAGGEAQQNIFAGGGSPSKGGSKSTESLTQQATLPRSVPPFIRKMAVG
jgi:hypothetical protein